MFDNKPTISPDVQLGTLGWPMRFSQLIKGDYLVTCRFFQDLTVQGCDLEEAQTNARLELEGSLGHCITQRLPFPAPSTKLLEDEQFVKMSLEHEQILQEYWNDLATRPTLTVKHRNNPNNN